MDKSTQITPESSPSVFKERADEIIKLLNETPSDVGSSIIQDTIEIRSNERKAREEPAIKGNELASSLYANSNSFEFWTYCDEELDSSILKGPEGNGIGARGRPAKATLAGGNGDKNPQTKRPRGRPAKAAANGTTIKVVQESEQQPASGEDVGRGTEQQSSDMQEFPATVAKHSILDKIEDLDSFEDFVRYMNDQKKKGCRYFYSSVRSIYEIAKNLSDLSGLCALKGPLIIHPELCQRGKIERMEVVLNKEIKKSFYYAIIDRKGELWERKEIDRVLQQYKCSIGIGKNYKNFCPTLKGCKLENGKCRINGKSDHVLNHIRGQLGFRFDCLYCDAYRTANTQHFKRHFLHYHWTRGFDEIQLPRKKPTTKSAETVNDSSDSDDDKGKKKRKR